MIKRIYYLIDSLLLLEFNYNPTNRHKYYNHQHRLIQMGIAHRHNQIKNGVQQQTSHFEWVMPLPNEQLLDAMLHNNQYQYDVVAAPYNYVCL